MRIFTISLFLFCNILLCQTNNKEIDSLKLRLKKTAVETEILDLNFKIAKSYYKEFDFQNATTFAKKNISIANNLKLKSELAETYKFLTLVYIILNMIVRTITIKKVLNYLKN